MPTRKTLLRALSLLLVATTTCHAQFLDEFDDDSVADWDTYTGDGAAEAQIVQKDGFARLLIDASNDRHNVWWAIIKRDVSSYLDLSKLADPSYELRVEARVRVSDAPRRLNMMVNTQRTTDYHIDLREYDIADTSEWHVMSMTTTALDAVPGDSLFVQLAATDWGLGQYHVDVDYYRADIVNVDTAPPDKGEPLAYHPPIPETNSFSNHLPPSHDSVINSRFPAINFNDWHVEETRGNARILTVSADQWPILRWDFEQREHAKADGPGLLELTTQSVLKGGDYVGAYGEDLGIEFGKIRIIEIFGGDPDWKQDTVTYDSFMRDGELTDVINSQMTFDVELSAKPGSKTFITLQRPVMQRLLSGQTKGLIIRPLGALDASFYSSEESESNRSPVLHFNIRE